MSEKKYYSTTECARLLGVSRITIFNWIREKKIFATKQAGNYLVSSSEMEKLQEKGHLHSADQKVLRAFASKLIAEYSELLVSLE